MKDKILCFLGVFFYVLCSIGAFIYALLLKAWPVALAVVFLSVLSFPVAKEWYKKLIP